MLARGDGRSIAYARHCSCCRGLPLPCLAAPRRRRQWSACGVHVCVLGGTVLPCKYLYCTSLLVVVVLIIVCAVSYFCFGAFVFPKLRNCFLISSAYGNRVARVHKDRNYLYCSLYRERESARACVSARPRAPFKRVSHYSPDYHPSSAAVASHCTRLRRGRGREIIRGVTCQTQRQGGGKPSETQLGVCGASPKQRGVCQHGTRRAVRACISAVCHMPESI